MKNSKVFEEAKIIIAEKHGKCLTEFCDNQYNKIEVKCDKGHIWKTSYKNGGSKF